MMINVTGLFGLIITIWFNYDGDLIIPVWLMMMVMITIWFNDSDDDDDAWIIAICFNDDDYDDGDINSKL